VIATESGGNKELISDRIDGFLIKPFDIKMLTEKIVLLLDNPSKVMEMGNAAKRKITSEFSIDRMVRGYTNLYDKLVQ